MTWRISLQRVRIRASLLRRRICSKFRIIRVAKKILIRPSTIKVWPRQASGDLSSRARVTRFSTTIETLQRKLSCATLSGRYPNSLWTWALTSKTESGNSHPCENSLKRTRTSQKTLYRMPSDTTTKGCTSRAPTPTLMDTNAMQSRLKWKM